jgi:hypothetical protein
MSADSNNGPRPGPVAGAPARDAATLDIDALAEALAERLVQRVGAAVSRRYFSVADAATYSGLSADSIRSLLSSGKLTGYRPVSGRVVIDRRELDSLIQASTRVPRRRRGTYDRAEAGQTKDDSGD